jgi:outer membrane protein
MFKIFNVILLLILSGVIVFAQEKPMELSLKEAREYALQNNKSLKNARFDLVASDEKLKETIANGLPQVNATIDYLTYFNYSLEFGLGGDAQTTDPLAMIELLTSQGVNIDAMDQGDFETIKAISIMQSQGSPTSIEMDDQSTAKIQLSQLIFSGQYYIGIRTARLAKLIANKNIEKTALDVKENVTNSYYLTLITEKTIEIIKKNKENLEKIRKQTEAMYKAGIAESTDVDQIDIQVAMLDNTIRSLERNRLMNYNMLLLQLGMDFDTNIRLSGSLDFILDTLDAENSLAMDLKLDKNKSYQMVQAQEAVSAKMLEMEKWAYAPTISGYYAYNEKILTTGFDMTPNHMAGVTMNIPVFSSGLRKHNISKAKVELEKARNNRSLVSDQLLLQEKQLKYNLKSALDNYRVQKNNVDVAKRVYDNINRKYQQGMVSSLDLTLANSNYLQAQNTYIESVMSLLQAKTSLDRLLNEL